MKLFFFNDKKYVFSDFMIIVDDHLILKNSKCSYEQVN